MRTEPFLHTLSRVDWWAVSGLLMIAVSALLSGWIITAIGHFLIKRVLA